ncbi:MAG: hypothetical protein AB1405_12130 [Bdellovibrionota bacterium]
MDVFEELVMQYLTKNGHAHTFVCPQFSIKAESGKEWSCPDFVALDFKNRQVKVVEVTINSDPRKTLGKKLKQKDGQWINLLRKQLAPLGISEESGWGFGVLAFVREEYVEAFAGSDGISVVGIETIAVPWKWDWSERR